MSKKIGKLLVMREREVMFSPVYWVPISYSSSSVRKIYGANIADNWMLFSGGRLKSFFLQEKWDKAAAHIGKKLFSDAQYFRKLKKKFDLAFAKSEKFYKKEIKASLGNKSLAQLISRTEKIRDVFINCEDPETLAWFTGSEHMHELLRKDLKIQENDFLFLTTPEQKTMVGQMEVDILKAVRAILLKKKKTGDLAKKLSFRYGWIPFAFDGPIYWDERYFSVLLKKEAKKGLKKIDSEIREIEGSDRENRKRRERIIKDNRLTKKQLDRIMRFNEVAVWTDERKVYLARMFRLFALVIKELEKRYKISYKTLKYLFIEELAQLEKDKKTVIEIAENRIKNPFLMKFDENSFCILSEKERDLFLNEAERQLKTSDIRGIVASRGEKNIYRGKVAVLLSPKECGKVREGDFIVATMTTPDYVVAMKKAAAFITDEGGVTCHAAIVAREMKKPCIIGTKIATKVLKDGDRVEVDANKGMVKIIK